MCVCVCVCVGKLPVKSTILPNVYAEPRHSSINGHPTLPSNVTSSQRHVCNGVAAANYAVYKPETVSTPTHDDDRSPAQDDQPSVASQSSPKIRDYFQRQRNYLLDDVTSCRSTPSCDVTHPSTELPVEYSASSTLSSAASSSFVTSEGVTSLLDDVRDEGTLRQRPGNAGSASVRAHARLSAIVGQLLALAMDDDDSGQQATVDVDRLLRRLIPEPEMLSAATVTGSVFELLDEVVVDCGLDTAIRVLVDGLSRARHSSTGGGHLGHVIELLSGVGLLVELVTSLNGLDSEAKSCECTCDAARCDDAAEIDVQLTSASDCVADDATLSRRTRYQSGGRTTDCQFRSRRVAVNPSALHDDDGGGFEQRLPALSVRVSSLCLCDKQRTVPLVQLLSSTRCVYELALVKVNLDVGLSSWLADALRFNTSLVRLDLRLSCLGDGDAAAAALGDGLSRHCRLRTLNLAGTGLTDAALCRLLAALSANRKLAELDVGFNDLATGSGCLALADALRTRRPPLRRLRMRNDGISWSTSTVAPFFRCTARSPRLRCLDVSGNVLGDDGISQLAEALLISRTLRELHVECCQFGQRGCRALARALRSNDALLSLQMSRNAVGDEGFSEVVGALRYNRAVTSLGANQCRVGNVGLAHLLDALRHNVSVTLVKLCYNDIGRHGAVDGTGIDRRRRRGRAGVLTTSSSSLLIIRDDAVRDDRMTSFRCSGTVRPAAADKRPLANVLPPTSGRSVRYSYPPAASTMTRCVRSFDDVTSGLDDDVTPPLNELYARLREVLHENARLKILLWGNKVDTWILESPVTPGLKRKT